MNNVKSAVKQPWFIRRITYLITSLLLLVLAAFGVINVEQSDQFLDIVMQVVLPVVSAATTGMAATKATETADLPKGHVDINDRLKVIENAIASPATTPAEDLEDDEPVEKYTSVYDPEG